MKLKNVDIRIPTVKELVVIKNELDDGSLIFDYCISKFVEWVIANGGLKSNYKEIIETVPRAVAWDIFKFIIYRHPEELKYLDKTFQDAEFCKSVFEAQKRVQTPNTNALDSLLYMPQDEITKHTYFLEDIVCALYNHLQVNPYYRFESSHAEILKSILKVRLLKDYPDISIYDDTPTEVAIREELLNIDPLYILEDKIKESHNIPLNIAITRSIKEYSSRYRINASTNKEYCNESLFSTNTYCKKMLYFFEKHGRN